MSTYLPIAFSDHLITMNPLTSRTMLSNERFHFSLNGGDHTTPRDPVTASVAVADPVRFAPDLAGGSFGPRNPSWRARFDRRSPSTDGSDDDLEEDGDIGGGTANSSSEKANGLRRKNQVENVITIVEPELYCTQMLNGEDGPGTSTSAQKEIGGDNGYGLFGRKEVGLLVDSEESLRIHLADPITGLLMNDAMILPCGHSFGSGGIQHVLRVKSCFRCSRPISEESVRPNLALRHAVQAFQREVESQSHRVSRKRDRFEQEKSSYDDPYLTESRGKGVQFPFVVSDRVIIKGNKRTPQRFVGRVAVVTTQCLNGWYVVKTLDNAESVKLQYRSLEKFPDDLSTHNTNQANKSAAPNWL